MGEKTTMTLSRSNLAWLNKIKDRLGLRSPDIALSKVKQTFKNLKLEGEL